MPRHGEGDDRLGMFEYQPPAVLNQANPTQNEWYDILPPTDNVRVYSIAVNIEDTNEDIEVRVTVDGEVSLGAQVGTAHSTAYFIITVPEPITRTGTLQYTIIAEFIRNKVFVVEGHTVQVEVRKTSAVGVGNLTGIVLYGVLTRI